MAKLRCHLASIQTIMSHPQPLAQCRAFLQSACPDVTYVSALSTAQAAEQLFQSSDDGVSAVVGPVQLASRYGLHVLKENIHDFEHNQTRFFVLGKEKQGVLSKKNKTSIIVGIDKNIPGSLYHILSFF